jgi:hypothetical protein
MGIDVETRKIEIQLRKCHIYIQNPENLVELQDPVRRGKFTFG